MSSNILKKGLLFNNIQFNQSRNISTKGKQFLAIFQDYKDSGCLERRLGIREKHFVDVRLAKKNGDVELGGAILDNHKSATMKGSFVLYNADSVEEVEQLIKKDPYYKTKVWEKWEIYPVKRADI